MHSPAENGGSGMESSQHAVITPRSDSVSRSRSGSVSRSRLGGVSRSRPGGVLRSRSVSVSRAGIRRRFSNSMCAQAREVERAIADQRISVAERVVLEQASQELRCLCNRVANARDPFGMDVVLAAGPLRSQVLESRFLAITLVVWRHIDTPDAALGAALGADGRRDAVKQIVAEVFSWLVRPFCSQGGTLEYG